MQAINIESHIPDEVSTEQWHDIQDLLRTASETTMTSRESADLDYLFSVNDFAGFVATRLNPNLLTSYPNLPNNVYTNPKITFGLQDERILAYMYTAHRASTNMDFREGNYFERWGGNTELTLKQMSIVNDPVWMREVAVQPRWQHGGLAKQLASVALEGEVGVRGVVTDIWPEEIDFANDSLLRLGFYAVGKDTHASVFGPRKPEVKLRTMKAGSVSTVRKLLQL